MAHRFVLPSWSGADGAAVTSGQPIPGTTDTWPQSGAVYLTTQAAWSAMASSGDSLWLPHGYRMTPSGGAFFGTDTNTKSVSIRAYAAGRGSRDTSAEAAARAAIYDSVEHGNVTAALSSVSDLWDAMVWPVLDARDYIAANQWTHTGSGVWRMTFSGYVSGSPRTPKINRLFVGAAAPSNYTSDLALGTARQQAFTLGEMSATPPQDTTSGCWYSFVSDASGNADDTSGTYTTVLFDTGSTTVDPTTLHSGIAFLRAGMSPGLFWRCTAGVPTITTSIWDVCLLGLGDRSLGLGNSTSGADDNTGAHDWQRIHVLQPCDHGFKIYDSIHHAPVTATDCSVDFMSLYETHVVSQSVEPRATSGEGFSFGRNARNITFSGGFVIGGPHTGITAQYDGTTNEVPQDILVENVAVFFRPGPDRGRAFTLCGKNVTYDGLRVWGHRTKCHLSANDGTCVMQNFTIGGLREAGEYGGDFPHESYYPVGVNTSINNNLGPGSILVRNGVIDVRNAPPGMLTALNIGQTGSNLLPGVADVQGLTILADDDLPAAVRVIYADSAQQTNARAQTLRHVRICSPTPGAIPQASHANVSVSSSSVGTTGAMASIVTGTVLHVGERTVAAAFGGGDAPAGPGRSYRLNELPA